jgi:APA family basic amino acid/polyamine antiporter
MEKLKRSLSLFDAVNISLGTIIGAGIFVIIGSAAALAGPAIFLSVIVAGLVSLLTGLSSAGLSKRFPRSGGAYLFAKETISDFFGFVVGWVWLFSNIVTGATVAVGFGYYLAFFVPRISIHVGGASAIVLAVAVHLLGTKKSSRLNNILVLIKLLILFFFTVSAIFFLKSSNFRPLFPFGIRGVWAGAATIFFAYAGFARVAVIADEVIDPVKTVPRATIISITISTLIYVFVAVAAVGIAGYQALAKSGSPLAEAIHGEGFTFGSQLVGAGALVATGTVILASILGVSRLAQTMAADGELPAFIGRISRRTKTPDRAILLSGTAMLVLVLLVDLPHIAYISSFSLLLYYAAIDLSGLKILGGRMRVITLIGLLSLLVLMFHLPSVSWLVGFVVVMTGILYYRIFCFR